MTDFSIGFTLYNLNQRINISLYIYYLIVNLIYVMSLVFKNIKFITKLNLNKTNYLIKL
jgi:hypothetical protein